MAGLITDLDPMLAAALDDADVFELTDVSSNTSFKITRGELRKGLSPKLFTSGVTVSTPAATTETTLGLYAMPADTLGLDGDAIRVIAAGLLGNTTRGRTLRFYLGSTVVVNIGAMAASTSREWRLEATIVRASTTSLKVLSQFTVGNIGNAVDISTYTDVQTIALNTAASQDVKITGQSSTGAVAADLTAELFAVYRL